MKTLIAIILASVSAGAASLSSTPITMKSGDHVMVVVNPANVSGNVILSYKAKGRMSGKIVLFGQIKRHRRISSKSEFDQSAFIRKIGSVSLSPGDRLVIVANPKSSAKQPILDFSLDAQTNFLGQINFSGVGE